MHRRLLRTVWIWMILILTLSVAACVQAPSIPASATPGMAPSDTSTPPLAASPAPVESPTPTVIPSPVPSLTPTASPPHAPEPIQTGKPVTFTQVVMHTVSEGWAINMGGQVFHTSDGTAQWQEVTPKQAVLAPRLALAAAFPTLKPESGLVAYAQAGSNSIQVFRTQDVGKNWESSEIAGASNAEPPGIIQLYSQDGQHAWLLGEIYPGMFHVYASIYSSQDGGATWTRIQDPQANPDSPNMLKGVYSLPYGPEILTFLNDQAGFAGTGELQQTVDGGKTWQTVSLPKGPDYPKLKQASEYVLPPRFTSPQDGAFLLRVDEAESIFCPPCDLYQGLPQALYLYITHDAGKTWTPYPAPARTGSFTFLDGDQGYFLGKDDADPKVAPRLFHTADGAKSWTTVSTKNVPPLGSALQFVDAQHGFAYNLYVPRGHNPFQAFDPAAGDNAYLYETSDGGASWTQVNPVY